MRALCLSALVTFTSMALAGADFPAIRITAVTMISAALLTSGVMAVRRNGQTATLLGVSVTAANAPLFSLTLLAWSVFLLLVFVSWQAAASAALALPALAVLARRGRRQDSNDRLLLDSCLIAWPAIVAGVAATSSIEPSAILLFAIIFYWSGIDLRLTILCDRFEAFAGDPSHRTADQVMANRIRLLALQLVIISMLPVAVLPLISVDGGLGLAYPVVAVVTGMMVIYFSSGVARQMDDVNLRRTGDVLTLYPFLFVLALIVDRMLQ